MAERYGLPADQVQGVAQELRGLHCMLRPAFERYWGTQQFDPAFTVAGYSLGLLTQRHGFHPLTAFLWLNSLYRNPREATSRLYAGAQARAKNLAFWTIHLKPPDKLPSW